MGHSWISIFGWAMIGVSLTMSWWKGSWAERYGALLLLFSNVSSDVAMALAFPHTPQMLLFIIDFLLAVGLLALALRFSSLWLGLAMLLQSIALFAHAYVFGGDGLDELHWMIINNVISALMLGCIIVATMASWRARHANTRTSRNGISFQEQPAAAT